MPVDAEIEIERLSEAIAWLCEAASAAGATKLPTRLTPKAKGDAEELVAEINRAIHPCCLPPDIEWFWTTWDAHSFAGLTHHPSLITPDFAFDVWKRDLEWPRALIFLAYESHCFLAVELEFDGTAGPRIYSDCYASGDGFRLRSPDLASMVSASAVAIEDGDVEISRPLDVVYLSVGGDETMEQRYTEVLDARQIGHEERGPFDFYTVPSWPKRWQAQQGVDEASGRLRGPTHTISDLLTARRRGDVTATILGRPTSRAGSSSGVLVVVDDGTGTVDVWVPSSVPGLGLSQADAYEYDVVATQTDGRGPVLGDFDDDMATAQRKALALELIAAAEALRGFDNYLHGRHAVIATAVRPA